MALRRRLSLVEKINLVQSEFLNEILKDSLTSVYKQLEIAAKQIIANLKNRSLDLTVIAPDEDTELYLPQPCKVQEAIAFLLFFHFVVPETPEGKLYEAFLTLDTRFANLTQPGSVVVRILLQSQSWEEIIEKLVVLKDEGYLEDIQAATRNWKDSFANFLKKLKRRSLKKTPRYPQRKRGYTDKGHLADQQKIDRRQAQSEILSQLGTSEQNELESQREMVEELINNFHQNMEGLHQEYLSLISEAGAQQKVLKKRRILS